MAWPIEGRERLESWLRSSSDFDALFAVGLWLERVRSNGPSPDDDVIDGYLRVHAEGTVLITYLTPPGRHVIIIENILEIDISGSNSD